MTQKPESLGGGMKGQKKEYVWEAELTPEQLKWLLSELVDRDYSFKCTAPEKPAEGQ